MFNFGNDKINNNINDEINHATYKAIEKYLDVLMIEGYPKCDERCDNLTPAERIKTHALIILSTTIALASIEINEDNAILTLLDENDAVDFSDNKIKDGDAGLVCIVRGAMPYYMDGPQLVTITCPVNSWSAGFLVNNWILSRGLTAEGLHDMIKKKAARFN